MSTVIFVPGLQGEKALKYAYTSAVGANEAAVIKAARDTESAYQKLSYQSPAHKNPTLFQMECQVAAQLDRIAMKEKGSPLICVGSSVGFGVLIGAISRLQNTTSPIALIGFKPVPDPLKAIELQINNPAIVAGIKNGAIPKAPMPVESAEGLKDTFFLSAKHLNDKRATRMLSDKSGVARLTNNHAIESASIIYGTKDHLTPSAHMSSFAMATNRIFYTDLTALDGTHATDFTDSLHREVTLAVARLG